MITRDVIEDGMCASDLVELLDEAKKEMPKMPYIPPFVIQEGSLNHKQATELDEYLRNDMAWKSKWFGEGKYIE